MKNFWNLSRLNLVLIFLPFITGVLSYISTFLLAVDGSVSTDLMVASATAILVSSAACVALYVILTNESEVLRKVREYYGQVTYNLGGELAREVEKAAAAAQVEKAEFVRNALRQAIAASK